MPPPLPPPPPPLHRAGGRGASAPSSRLPAALRAPVVPVLLLENRRGVCGVPRELRLFDAVAS